MSKSPPVAPTRATAQSQIAQMKRKLRGWLRLRKLNDERSGVSRAPDEMAVEQALATDIYNLLSQVMDPQSLPSPDVIANPHAAVQLARVLVDGKLPPAAPGQSAQGILPIIVMTVGAVILFTITSSISNRAEVAKEQERQKCLREGDLIAKLLCADFSNVVMLGALGYGGYWLLTRTDLGKKVGVKQRRRR